MKEQMIRFSDNNYHYFLGLCKRYENYSRGLSHYICQYLKDGGYIGNVKHVQATRDLCDERRKDVLAIIEPAHRAGLISASDKAKLERWQVRFKKFSDENPAW